MHEPEFYSTENSFLCAFIRANGIAPRCIRKTGRYDSRGNAVCEFVLDALKTDKRIEELEIEWFNSETGKMVSRVLSASKAMRSELKEFLASDESLEQEAHEVLRSAMEE